MRAGPPVELSVERLRELIEVGRGLVHELSLERLLDRVLRVARDLTGASYVAVGILDERRQELERFLTLGVDDVTQRAIGDLPRGRGVLGVLIEHPEPLRLDDVSSHPRSYGFPLNHPPMTTFLGVPITVRGEAWGNLYLTDKQGGEPFTDADEAAVLILADWVAVAVENARLFQRARGRNEELERAVRALEATTAISQAIGGETRLDRVLELIAKRCRALVSARALVILLVDGGELVVAACAGELPPGTDGVRLPIDASIAGGALRRRSALRIDALEAHLGRPADSLGLRAQSALFMPLTYRNADVGVLAAYDRIGDRASFDADDELLIRSFAASAGTAVATAKLVGEEQLRRSIAATERERRRWARELHDELLQELGALRLRMSGSLRSDDPAAATDAVREGVERIDRTIQELRSLISQLRPAALDDFGLGAALEGLVERIRAAASLEVDATFALGSEGDGPRRFGAEAETAAFRLVQEALNNVQKHADASAVRIDVRADGRGLAITISDDGRGFDVDAATDGFGLPGMRERVKLLGGELEVSSNPEGTTISARIPPQVGERRVA